MDLAFMALDHGVGSVAQAGQLTPFVVTEVAGERRLSRFAAERLEEGLAYARAFAREADDAQRVAVVYDGYLTLAGERSDAVYVEAQERGAETAVVLAQRYRPAGRFKKFATIGNPGLLGPGDPLF
jgi:hypothetical protein